MFCLLRVEDFFMIALFAWWIMERKWETENAWIWVETVGLCSNYFHWSYILLLHGAALGRCHCFTSSLRIAYGLSRSF